MKQILFSGCLLFLVSTGALAQRERSALLPGRRSESGGQPVFAAKSDGVHRHVGTV